MAQRQIDWEYWRHRYVTGDDSVTLDFLSGIPNAPSLVTLKKHSTKDGWTQQRKAFRYQVDTRVYQDPVTRETVTRAQAVATQTQKLVDVAEIITQHLLIARGARAIISRRLKEILSSPEEISKLSFRDLGSMLKTVTDIERLAMGLATERAELNVNIDLSTLSDEQLERLALGEDPMAVLN